MGKKGRKPPSAPLGSRQKSRRWFGALRITDPAWHPPLLWFGIELSDMAFLRVYVRISPRLNASERRNFLRWCEHRAIRLLPHNGEYAATVDMCEYIAHIPYADGKACGVIESELARLDQVLESHYFIDASIGVRACGSGPELTRRIPSRNDILREELGKQEQSVGCGDLSPEQIDWRYKPLSADDVKERDSIIRGDKDNPAQGAGPLVTQALLKPLEERTSTKWVANIVARNELIGALLHQLHEQAEEAGVKKLCDIHEAMSIPELEMRLLAGFTLMEIWGMIYFTQDVG